MAKILLEKQTNEELAKQLASTESELQALVFKANANQLKNVRAIRVLRKKIAMIRTALAC